MTNLISNSINYGSDKGTTEISFDESGAKLLVKVTDNGDGISEENMPRLFERFFRSVDTRNLPGSGIGLSIVEEIIMRHKGHVFVKAPENGSGTEVGFTL